LQRPEQSGGGAPLPTVVSGLKDLEEGSHGGLTYGTQLVD
jgi:hypothetical protein